MIPDECPECGAFKENVVVWWRPVNGKPDEVYCGGCVEYLELKRAQIEEVSA